MANAIFAATGKVSTELPLNRVGPIGQEINGLSVGQKCVDFRIAALPSRFVGVEHVIVAFQRDEMSVGNGCRDKAPLLEGRH